MEKGIYEKLQGKLSICCKECKGDNPFLEQETYNQLKYQLLLEINQSSVMPLRQLESELLNSVSSVMKQLREFRTDTYNEMECTVKEALAALEPLYKILTQDYVMNNRYIEEIRVLLKDLRLMPSFICKVALNDQVYTYQKTIQEEVKTFETSYLYDMKSASQETLRITDKLACLDLMCLLAVKVEYLIGRDQLDVAKNTLKSVGSDLSQTEELSVQFNNAVTKTKLLSSVCMQDINDLKDIITLLGSYGKHPRLDILKHLLEDYIRLANTVINFNTKKSEDSSWKE